MEKVNIRKRYITLRRNTFFVSKGTHLYMGLNNERLHFDVNKEDITVTKSDRGYNLQFSPHNCSYKFSDPYLAKWIRGNFNLEGNVYLKVDAKGNEFKLTPNV